MAPIVIALLMATGWLLTISHDQPVRDWPLYVLTLLTTLMVWRTHVHILWLIGLGAILGGLGWV
jgi:chromate transporter